MNIPVTEGIYLTEVRESDIPVITELANDELIHRNTLSFPHPFTEQHACDFYEKCASKERELGYPIHFAIRNNEGQLMGVIGRVFNEGLDPHRDEVGYWMGRPYSGKGVTTKALDAFINYWFEHSAIIRFSGCVFPDNLASIRVLEKAGFQREGLMKSHTVKNGKARDVLLYARLKG